MLVIFLMTSALQYFLLGVNIFWKSVDCSCLNVFLKTFFFQHLIKSLIQPDLTRRLTMEQLLNHPFFQEIRERFVSFI